MNNRIISKTGFFGFVGWTAVAGLSVLMLRRAPQVAAPFAESDVQLAHGVFERATVEHPRSKSNTPVTEEDWSAAKEFLELHSPNRYHMLESIPSGETREGLKHFLVNRWRNIAELKTKSPDLYTTRVREVELDDDVFDICLRLRHSKGDQKQLQSELNAKIVDLFNLGLTERQQRISLVERSLVDQKKTLESDEHDKAKLAQQQYQYVLTHGVEGARLDSGPGRHSGDKSKPGSSTVPSPGESEPHSP